MGCATIYNSKDLPGEWLLIPLKSYREFFANKIRSNSGCAKVALVIVNIVTGLLVYPLFGILALIGMGIKRTGISSLREHNEREIRDLEGQCTALEVEERRFVVQRFTGKQHVFREFEITKKNAGAKYAEAIRVIRDCVLQLKKIYVEVTGSIQIKDNTDAITIRLMTDSA